MKRRERSGKEYEAFNYYREVWKNQVTHLVVTTTTQECYTVVSGLALAWLVRFVFAHLLMREQMLQGPMHDMRARGTDDKSRKDLMMLGWPSDFEISTSVDQPSSYAVRCLLLGELALSDS